MNKKITIKINGVEYQISQSFRSLMIFEEMTGKKIANADDSVTDLMKMFYSIMKGCNKNFQFEFGEFLDLVDDFPETFEVFTNFLTEQAKGIEAEQEPKKKKKTN